MIVKYSRAIIVINEETMRMITMMTTSESRELNDEQCIESVSYIGVSDVKQRWSNGSRYRYLKWNTCAVTCRSWWEFRRTHIRYIEEDGNYEGGGEEREDLSRGGSTRQKDNLEQRAQSEFITCQQSDNFSIKDDPEKDMTQLVENIEVIECDALLVEKRCRLNSKAAAVQLPHFLIRCPEINHCTKMLLYINDWIEPAATLLRFTIWNFDTIDRSSHGFLMDNFFIDVASIVIDSGLFSVLIFLRRSS